MRLKLSACSPGKSSPSQTCIHAGLQVEEFYVITWEAKKEQVFEMPTGGAAIMRSGPNLLKLARKEQCLALLSQLRTKFKTDGQFYRVFPDGEVQYLHPKDGVYPEKVNQGRQAVGANDRSIGKNPNPVSVSLQTAAFPVATAKADQARKGQDHLRGYGISAVLLCA